MAKKKIEPTDAMVDEAANMLSLHATGTSLQYQADGDARPYRNTARTALRAALNHPDTPGLFADEDALRAAREQGWDQAVEWIEEDQGGPSGRTTNARNANPHRPVQDLPTDPETAIERADGHKYITATVDGETWRTREAILSWGRHWYAVWRSGNRTRVAVRAEHITPGSWKVDDQ